MGGTSLWLLYFLLREVFMKTVVLLVLLGIPVIALQERAPTGQIYQELVPFVGLEGVRLEVHGLEGTIFDVVPPIPKAVADRINAEHQQIDNAIRADTIDAFEHAGIPLLSPVTIGPEVRPALVINVSWQEIKPEVITTEVVGTLIEAAHPLKDPSRVVWSSSWGTTYRSVSSPQNLAADLRALSRSIVSQFVGLYVRAHKK